MYMCVCVFYVLDTPNTVGRQCNNICRKQMRELWNFMESYFLQVIAIKVITDIFTRHSNNGNYCYFLQVIAITVITDIVYKA